MTRFGIIGGGLSGLSAAFHLLRADPNAHVTLLEASARLGGWICSQRHADGSYFELGPRSVRASDVTSPLMLRMAEEAGLADHVTPIRHDAAATRNRFLFVRNQLTRLTGSLFRPAGPFQKPLLPAAWGFLTRGGKVAEMQQQSPGSVDSYFRALCGPEVADVALNALMRGIYAGDAKQLGFREVFPRLQALQDRHGSLLKGLLAMQLGVASSPALASCGLSERARRERWVLWGLRGGMQTFTEAVSELLAARGADLQLNAACSGLQFGARGISCQVAGREPLEFDHVMLALPSDACLQLLRTHTAFSELQAALAPLRFADVAVVGLEFDGSLLPVDGFGHLIPSWEIPHVLGTTYDSCIFPESARGITRIGTMFGGAWFDSHCADMTEADFVRLAEDCARTHLGIRASPKRLAFRLNRRCIPQYGVGHFERVEAARKALAGSPHRVDLLGSSFDGVSVNDCVHSGFKAAQQLTTSQR